MKNSNDKRMLIKLQCSCESVENNELIGADENKFDHEEADESIIS